MGKYTKAIAAAALVASAEYASAILDASRGGDAVTGNELRDLLVKSVIAGILVWAVPNKPETR